MDRLEIVSHFRKPLFDGFELRSLTPAEFQPLWDGLYPIVFGKKAQLNVQDVLSQTERDHMNKLGKFMGSPLHLPFGIFQGDRFVGWHVGDQKSREEFYMRNSGVLPEFQGRGLYTAMLKAVLGLLSEVGFQVISSKHNATNNQVIVLKLKQGFVITGLEISDKFGTLVRLEWNFGDATVHKRRCTWINRAVQCAVNLADAVATRFSARFKANHLVKLNDLLGG